MEQDLVPIPPDPQAAMTGWRGSRLPTARNAIDKQVELDRRVKAPGSASRSPNAGRRCW